MRQAGEQLHAGGIPLYRLSYIQRTLHPEFIGYGFFWRRGHGVDKVRAPISIEDQSEYRDNPLPAVFEHGKTVRVRLEREADPQAPLLRQLQAEGATDYVALPVIFTDGRIDGLSVTSDAPGGFSRQDLDRMFALQFMFARIVEIHNLRATATNLLDTYVGHDAGARILDGAIHRGDGETIRAVIWYCDLRGFTGLSDHLPRDDLIGMLNDFFACMAGPVEAAGGQVLKFVGDAMLAIFRIGADDEKTVAGTALDAAHQAVGAAERLNRQRQADGKPNLDFGLALHIGDVMYGNIGAPSRLDFTVIGPAVNLAARLQAQSRDIGHAILCSAEIAALRPGRVVSCGPHRMKGMAAAVEVFTVR
ncbi:MAG: adenylate/guanylate cyclase domain-containing protein [Alphaproteobacteria bacterium]|nr:adenylate/guanylate cyclase domain-containing protein [Alphaproteobacteria bacterium]